MPLSISFNFDDQGKLLDLETKGLDLPTASQWEEVAKHSMRRYFRAFGEEEQTQQEDRIKEFGI